MEWIHYIEPWSNSLGYLLPGLLSLAALAVGGFFAFRDGSLDGSAQDVDVSLEQALIDFYHHGVADASANQLAEDLVGLVHSHLGGTRVMYLAARDGKLESTFWAGVPIVNRNPCRMIQTPELLARCSETPFPGDLAELESVFPIEVYQYLSELELQVCLPVCWRSRLYGLLCVQFNEVELSLQRTATLAALIRTLTTVSRLEELEDRFVEAQSRVSRLERRSKPRRSSDLHRSLRVLRLVRHRDSDTLVGRIIEEVQLDLRLRRYVFVYESRRDDEPLRWHAHGIDIVPPDPQPDEFRSLITAMKRHDPDTAIDLRTTPNLTLPLAVRLCSLGMKYAVAFPVARNRSGLLAWEDGKSPQEVINILRQHRQSFKELMDNAESFERIEEMSYTDNLTGLANRRYFNRRLIEEIGRAKRYHRTLGLIMLDLDELKLINDSYGHQAGDELIRQLGAILRQSIRAIDVTARYGGDEFCVIMPESDRVTCLRFMNRLKHKIAGVGFPISQLGKELSCTVSQGGAVYPDNGMDSAQLIFAADMALLRSKEKGRNQYNLYEK